MKAELHEMNWSGASSAESGCGGGVGGVEAFNDRSARIVGSAGRLTSEHLALHSLRGVTDERKRNAARRIVESPKQGNNWRPRLTIRRGEIPAGKPTMRALLFLAGAAVGRCASDVGPRKGYNVALCDGGPQSVESK